MKQPAYQGIDVTYKDRADNKDIRDLLEKLVPDATKQMVTYSKKFEGKNEIDTCKNIFDFLKNDLKYVADGEQQIIKLPSALLRKKVGDCKSFSLLTASILANLNIPYTFVYASYNSNPIPAHVYVQTESGIIIDAVYGIFNAEKKANYKYKKNMKVGYMAGLGGCSCKGKCGCNQGVGDVWDDLRAKKEQAQRYLREKEAQAERFAKEQRDKAIAEAKKLRDKAEADAKALRDKAEKAAKDARDSIQAKAKEAQATINAKLQLLLRGSKTIGLSGGRALFMLMISNNLDGFATKLSLGNTTALLDQWKRVGGDRTKLAEALKKGASKPEKKFGFLPKLNAIYNKAGINGIGAVVDGGDQAKNIEKQQEEKTKVDTAQLEADAKKAIEKYKLDGNLQGLIATLCTSAGTTIGAVVGAAGGITAAGTAAIGTAAGGALGVLVISMTNVIVPAVRKTPKVDTDNAGSAPLTPPVIPPIDKETFVTGTLLPLVDTLIKTETGSGTPPPPPIEKEKPDNTMLYVGGGALLLAGIYFATKNK